MARAKCLLSNAPESGQPILLQGMAIQMQSSILKGEFLSKWQCLSLTENSIKYHSSIKKNIYLLVSICYALSLRIVNLAEKLHLPSTGKSTSSLCPEGALLTEMGIVNLATVKALLTREFSL